MDTRDITILRIVDGLWETYEWVPVIEIKERITWRIRFNQHIKQLEKLGLIGYNTSTYGEPAVKITERGLDTLAVWDFKKHGVIDDIGNVIGEGKEAVIVSAVRNDTPLAIKFHKYYSAEFHRIKRSLSYAVINWWRKRIGREMRPIDFPRAKAQIEYHSLKELHGSVNVPEPLGINRHAIVMEFIGDTVSAPLLSKVKKEAWMKKEILEDYQRALDKGIIHGDLSAFNVMVWDKLYLIDWPQSIPTDFKSADEMIKRDRKNIAKAFT